MIDFDSRIFGVDPALVGSFVRYSSAWVLSGLFRRPSHARGGGNNPFLIWRALLRRHQEQIGDANNVVGWHQTGPLSVSQKIGFCFSRLRRFLK